MPQETLRFCSGKAERSDAQTGNTSYDDNTFGQAQRTMLFSNEKAKNETLSGYASLSDCAAKMASPYRIRWATVQTYLRDKAPQTLLFVSRDIARFD